MQLRGRRVMVTRARGQASGLIEALEREGAEVIAVPAIEIVAPESYAGLDEMLGRVGEFDWIVFSSVNGVKVFVSRLQGREVRGEIAAVGSATAGAVEDAGLRVSVMPDVFIAEKLVEALAGKVAGKSVLVVGAEVSRDVLVEGLRRAGAVVEVGVAYRTVVPRESVEILMGMTDWPEVVTFTSASSVRNFFALVEAAGVTVPVGVQFVSIGAITSGTLRELGGRVDAEARVAGVEGLVDAVVACCA